VFFFNIITKIDLTITIGIIISHNFNRNVVDIFTIPSTRAFIAGIWRITIEIFRFWTVFVSPFIFTSNNTIVDFTNSKRTVFILVTIVNHKFKVISVNLVIKINSTITIGIIGNHNFFSDIDNVSTIPSTFTNSDSEWTFTIEISIIWTVFSSPLVFT